MILLNGIPLSSKKEGTTNACNSIDKSQEDYAGQKKTRESRAVSFHLYGILGKLSNLEGQEGDHWLPSGGSKD